MTIPDPLLKTGSDAEALDGATNPNIKLTHLSSGAGGGTSGWAKAFRARTDWTWDRLAEILGLGFVYQTSGGGLNVGIPPVGYEIAGVSKSYAGQDDVAMADDATIYLWLDASETLQTSSVPTWAAGEIHKLAVVTTVSGEITDITSAVARNWGRSVTAWSGQAATQAVDFAGFGPTDMGKLNFSASTELTIAAGVVTATGPIHSIDTESDAATDNLATISGGTDSDFLLIKAENAARVVTVQDGVGNIKLADGDYAMSADDYWLLLAYDGSNWYAIAQSHVQLKYEAATTRTIAAGVITRTQVDHKVATQSGDSTDDLDTINGGSEGDIIILRAADGDNTVVFKNGTGNLILPNGDFTADDANKSLCLKHDGTNWQEQYRSFVNMGALAVAGDKGIPWCQTIYFGTEALSSTGPLGLRVFVPADYGVVIRNIRAEVETVPSTTILIIDLKDDGASIFASAGEMANIAVAANGGTSTTKDAVVAAGSVLTIEVNQSDAAAANLTVTINGLAPAVTPV